MVASHSGGPLSDADEANFDHLRRWLGDRLVGLTTERDWLLDPDTYFARSTSSAQLPGALIDDFTLTL